jgi:hypothetical protein
MGPALLGGNPHPALKRHPLPMLGEGTKSPIYPHICVGKDLVPSRVSENHVGAITPGGHKTLPYDEVMIARRE